MAVPILIAIEHCADFSQTVEPFVPQLLELPQKLLAVDSVEGLLQVYLETNPLISGLAASFCVATLVLVISEINRNWSQVDRLWSIVPALYAGHFVLWARLSGFTAPRVSLAWAFTIIWSARLTYNYFRKGGYSIGSEDYRWPIVRRTVTNPLILFLFNAIFVALIQNVLLYSLAAPIYTMLLASEFEPKVMAGDLLFYAAELLLIFTEGIADQQQWEFHMAKHEYQKTAKVPKGFTQAELDRGFLTSGLWAYSRHPNFVCEQTIWFTLYQWSCYNSKVLYSWNGLGSLCLIMLFQGSTWLTEVLSAQKYPSYLEYQKQVSMFLPTGFSGYQTPERKPKVIRTSEIEKLEEIQVNNEANGMRKRAA